MFDNVCASRFAPLFINISTALESYLSYGLLQGNLIIKRHEKWRIAIAKRQDLRWNFRIQIKILKNHRQSTIDAVFDATNAGLLINKAMMHYWHLYKINCLRRHSQLDFNSMRRIGIPTYLIRETILCELASDINGLNEDE